MKINPSIFIACLLLVCGCVNDDRSEDLTIAGSTTVQPIVTRASEIYTAEHPEIRIGVQGGGSGTGIRMVGEGSVSIGASSRELETQEKEEHPDLLTHAVAIDCLAIVVHPTNNLETITAEQLKGIFLGEIKNFKEIGGPDRPIVLVIREDGSGTRSTFEKLAMDGEEASIGALQKPASGAIRFTISNNPNSIGYLGIGYLDETVKALEINRVYPSEENIKTGKYPLSRELYLVTRGEPTGKVKNFIDFILSEDGQEIVREEGFVGILNDG